MFWKIAYGFIALINLLAFVFGGWDVDKLIIALLFVCLILHELAEENLKKQNEILRKILGMYEMR